MWIDQSTGELSRISTKEPEKHVTPGLLRRLADAPEAWSEASGDFFAEAIEQVHEEMSGQSWTPDEQEFEFVSLPPEYVLSDKPHLDLTELLVSEVASIPLRWRLEIIDVLFDLIP